MSRKMVFSNIRRVESMRVLVVHGNRVFQKSYWPIDNIWDG